MVAAAVPIQSVNIAKALEHLRETATRSAAPPFFMSRLPAVERAALTAPNERESRRVVLRAWARLGQLRPELRASQRARRAFRDRLSIGWSVGDDPPQAVAVDWTFPVMPGDVDRFARDIDAAFDSLNRKIERSASSGVEITARMEESRAQFMETWGNWKRESARIHGSYWDRMWRDGMHAVENGAQSYAAARADLIAAGWGVRGTLPTRRVGPASATDPAARSRGLLDGLFGSGAGLAIAAVAVIFILSKNR